MSKIKIKVAGVGVVEVDAGFLDLSENEKQQTLTEIKQAHSTATSATVDNATETEPDPETQDSDWKGQTVGGMAGSIAGGAVGVALAPFTFGLSVPIGAVLGGALGGAAGEAAEQSLDNYFDDDVETKWNELSPQQQEEIISAGVEEGIWGLVPGVGSAVGKGTRLVIKGGTRKAGEYVAKKLKQIGASVLGRATGAVVPKAVAEGATKALDSYISKGGLPGVVMDYISKLDAPQKRQVLQDLFGTYKQIHKRKMSKTSKKLAGKSVDENKAIDDLHRQSIENLSDENVAKLFGAISDRPLGQQAISQWARNAAKKELAFASALAGGRGVVKSNSEVEVDSDSAPDEVDVKPKATPEVPARPKGGGRSGLVAQKRWDEQYGDKYHHDGRPKQSFNGGGEVVKRYEGSGFSDEAAEEIVEGAFIPDTITTMLPAGAFIVNAASANHPRFKAELMSMGGRIIRDGFKPIRDDHPKAVPALVGREEIYIPPHTASKHLDYLQLINDWGRDVKRKLGT